MISVRPFFFLVMLIGISGGLRASNLDSLLNVLSVLEDKNTPSDLRSKAIICQEIADWHNKTFSDQDDSRSYLLQAIYFREQFLEKAPEPLEEDYLDLVELYRKVALFEAFRGDFSASNEYIVSCENLLKSLKGLIPILSYNEALLDFYHSTFALSLNMGNIAQAESYWKQAYEIADNNPSLSYLRMNLLSERSVFYSRTGRHLEAVDFAKQGLALYEEQDTIDQPHDRFIHFVIRAQFYGEQYTELLGFIAKYPQYDSYLDMEKYLDANPNMVTRSFFENIFLLADAEQFRFEKSNDKDFLIASYEWAKTGFLLAEKVALQNDGEKIGNVILRSEEKLIKLLSIFHVYSDEVGGSRENVIELIRILDTYQSGRLHLERISQEVNANLWSREKELKNQIIFLNKEIEESADNEEIRNKHRKLSYELADLKKKTKRSQILEEYRFNNTQFSSRLESYLQVDTTTLITYFPDRANHCVYVIGVGVENHFFDKIQIENLTAIIERSYALNGQIQYSKDSLAIQKKLNHDLHNFLIAPFQSKFESDNLLISPMNELSYVSFDALLDNNNRYLVEDYRVSYSYSFYGIIADGKEVVVPKRFMCFYPSNYGIDSLSILSNAAEEVNTFEQNFNAEVFRSEEATKANFLNHASEADIIHLASHSMLNAEHPYRSYLVFNTIKNDSLNRLFAHEVFALNIQAEMVTLGSCNTAKGKIEDGTGIISLANAFYYSGIPSTVGSLWSAQDKSSSEIMVDFYANLKMGGNKSESLQRAKINYLKQADKIKKQPFFWANYVVYGNNQPLYEKGGSVSWWRYLIGAGLLVVLIFLGRKLF